MIWCKTGRIYFKTTDKPESQNSISIVRSIFLEYEICYSNKLFYKKKNLSCNTTNDALEIFHWRFGNHIDNYVSIFNYHAQLNRQVTKLTPC
jgi:hypothetical protein